MHAVCRSKAVPCFPSETDAVLKDPTMTTANVHPTTPPATPSVSQFALMRQRRFAPFFWTQFLGAMNDNVFKFALTIMVTYQLQVHWLAPAQAGLVIGAVFIFPFLITSATSGQLTDKWEKTRMIKLVKNLEMAIMVLAAFGFWRGDDIGVALLLLCVGLMGLHSTLFGPVKYALLPQVLNEREITGGNGMVEMGTFVAILLGNLLGGLLVVLPEVGHVAVAGTCLALAVLGRWCAHHIPPAAATDPALRVNWNPLSETWRNLQLARQNLVVFRSLLGISWMWFVGAVFLSQFPSFSREVLHGNPQVASLLLVVFSVGIGVGALLCEVLSRRHVEIGLVPLGAIGMSVFAFDLYGATHALPAQAEMGVAAFLSQSQHWRVMFDLAMVALSAGIYSVPMYALIQLRSPATHRARIIAANNILNALFMIASSVLAGALLAAGASIPDLFLLVAVLNLVVASYIFLLVPEYLLRFVAWGVSHGMYRFRVQGDEHIPASGPALLTCNHVSFVDVVLIMAASPRPVRFLMDHRIFSLWGARWFFKMAKAIPIAPKSEDEDAYRQAFETAQQVLKDGDLLCIFPEGGLTPDGRLQPFRPGMLKVVEQAKAEGLDVPVVPMALRNLWGSFFSRKGGAAMTRPWRRGLFNRVELVVGAPLHKPQLDELQAATASLLSQPR